MSVLETLGGAKFVLTVLALILVALRNVLGMDDSCVNLIVAIALGGGAALGTKDVIVAKQEASATKAANPPSNVIPPGL